MTLFGRDKERDGQIDLESLEQCIRASMHTVGSVMLEGLLNADNGGYQGRIISPDEGCYVSG